MHVIHRHIFGQTQTLFLMKKIKSSRSLAKWSVWGQPEVHETEKGRLRTSSVDGVHSLCIILQDQSVTSTVYMALISIILGGAKVYGYPWLHSLRPAWTTWDPISNKKIKWQKIKTNSGVLRGSKKKLGVFQVLEPELPSGLYLHILGGAPSPEKGGAKRCATLRTLWNIKCLSKKAMFLCCLILIINLIGLTNT